MPMAATGAPRNVRKSEISSLCFRYSTCPPLRLAIFGEKPMTSRISESVSRATLW